MGLWCCGPACISSRASPPPAEISRIPTSPATPGSIRPSNQPPRYSLSSTMPPPPKALLIPTDQRACVNGDCLMRRDDEWVDLHLGQAPVLQQKLRDPEQLGDDRGPVRRRGAAGGPPGGPAGQSLSQNPKDPPPPPLDRGAVGQRKRNASRLRLVRQVGRQRFERYGKRDPGRQPGRPPPPPRP